MSHSPEQLPLEEAFEEGKAIQGMAEEGARQEFRKSPESRHYERASQLIDQLKDLNPDYAKEFIEVAGVGKDLKDKMGAELYEPFLLIGEDIVEKEVRQYADALKTLEETLDPRDTVKCDEERGRLRNDFLTHCSERVASDPRLISMFEGKEQMLEEVRAFIQRSFLGLLEQLERA